jgi:DNA-binding MarR family transcriptional regulator
MLVLWEKDQLTVSEIGERLFLESSTLTPLLKKLEASKLITRQRSTKDERQVIITLTGQGEKLQEQAINIPNQIAQAASCTPATLSELKQQLSELRLNLTK